MPSVSDKISWDKAGQGPLKAKKNSEVAMDFADSAPELFNVKNFVKLEEFLKPKFSRVYSPILDIDQKKKL